MSSTTTCPVHKGVHHAKGPCKAALALRNKKSSPPRRPAQTASRRPRETNARAPSSVPRPRQPVRRLPEVTWDVGHDILGAPANAVSTYSLSSQHRTTLHPAFVGVRLLRGEISWLSYSAPVSVTGRIWFLIHGSNEPAPTVAQLKAHHNGFSMKAYEDGVHRFTPGKFEARLLRAAQEAHHYGGVKIHYVEEVTHATAATVVGRLKINATFTYEGHEDL